MDLVFDTERREEERETGIEHGGKTGRLQSSACVRREGNWEEAQAAATFRAVRGFGIMKTFFSTAVKVLLVIAVVVLIVKFWPLLALPAFVAAAVAALLGGVLAVATTVVLGVALAAVAIMLSALLAVAGATLPVWLPVLAILGVVALIRTLRRTHA